VSKIFSVLLYLVIGLVLLSNQANSSHISGIRITQTGNTGLMVNADVTGFYTTGSTETTMNLGTYYNQVPAIDWGDGSTVPRYGYGSSTGIPLVATSTVVNGIPARAYRGSFSHTYAGAGSYTISANSSCCALTTPTYTLVTGNIMTTTVSTTGPFGPTTFTTSFVQNTLDVAAVVPGFTKSFSPTSVAVGDVSTLTLTIDNLGSTLDNNSLNFVDNFPAGLEVASPSNVITSCTGGTVTATPGSSVVSYNGGAVLAGSSCSISVDVTPVTAGTFINTTSDLTSAFGNGGTASASLTGVGVPPGFSKAFSPNGLVDTFESTLTFTIDNTANAVDTSALSFTDNMPTGMIVAAVPNVINLCNGGTVTAVANSGTISYSGGSVSANSVCTISVDIMVDGAGDYDNDAGVLDSSFGSSAPASAIDRLIVAITLAVPTISVLGLILLLMAIGYFTYNSVKNRKLN